MKRILQKLTTSTLLIFLIILFYLAVPAFGQTPPPKVGQTGERAVAIQSQPNAKPVKGIEISFSKGLLFVRADDVELKALLAEVSRKTGIEVSIGSGLEEKKITVRFSNLDLESALRTILKSAGIDSHAWVYRPSGKSQQLGKWELATIHLVAQGTETGPPSTEITRQQKAVEEKQSILPAKATPGRELYFDKRSNKYVEVAEREIQVRFKKEVSEEEIAEAIREFAVTVISRHEGLKIYRLRIPASESVASFMEKHAANDKFITMEPNFFASSKTTALPPNDPLFSQQWALQKIEAPRAWDMTTGSPNVIVAIIDTGIDASHPDLEGKVMPGRNIIEQSENTTDDHGHGTAMAGVIAAAANNGIGIAGVCWSCRLMPVKALDAFGEGTYADVIEGILWAVDNKARVLNLALGGYVYSQMMADAVDYAHSAGAVIIAAGGNEDISDPLYPAAHPAVIGVSATDSNDSAWTPSNQGSYIKLSAPGVGIFSTGLDGGDILATGTSFSTAHVSGVAALVISKNPSLSNTQVEQILYRTADDLGDKGRDDTYGYGRVNAAKALGMASIEVHDVAVTRIDVEPQLFRVGETVQAVVTVTNLGTFAEKNLSVDLFLERERVGTQTITDILAGGSVSVRFRWSPPPGSQVTALVATVSPVEGEIAVDDNKRTRTFRLVAEDGVVKVQYNQLTHQWIGLQAQRMLPDGPMKTEFLNHLGTFGGDCSVTNSETGTTLREGMWDEDCDNHFFKHFWDPDTDTGLTVPGLGTYQSAIARAEELYPEAVSAYHGGNQERAYYVLGRVAHLLQDMAQPAHVHNDQHLCCNDYYESQVESFDTDYVWDAPRDASQTALISFLTEGLGYPLKPILHEQLGFWRYPSNRNTPLFRLFLNLAETADFFESEDRPGDADSIQNNQPASTISWHNPGEPAPGTFSDAEARAHADTLLPLAMRYVAGLYRLFWDETHPALTNGVAKTDSVAPFTWKFYSFTVPSEATSLTVTTTNATGDVDLYVKFNQTPDESDDSTKPNTCRPFEFDGNETCTFSNPTAGTWIIGVKNAAIGTQNYTVTATHSTTATPKVTSVSPSPVIGSNDRQWLTMNGSGFASGFTVTLRDVTNGVTYPTITDPGRLQFVSASEVQVFANVSANPATWSVKVTNPGGLSSSEFNFSVVAPTPVISSLNPNAATAGGPSFILTVNGSNFNLSSVVRWNGSSRTTTRIETSPGSGLVTRLEASISSSDIAAEGNNSVTVFNPSPGGGVSNPLTFTVGTLGALAVSPATGLISSGQAGGPFSPSSQTYTLTNTGGAAISWTASKTQSWLSLSKTSGTLAANGGQDVVTVSINSGVANGLAASAIPYTDTVTFTNTTNGSGNQTRSVSLSVASAGVLSIAPGTGLSSSGPPGGPFSPPSQTYTLTNTGSSTIDWAAATTSVWVIPVPPVGTLGPGGQTTATVELTANANGLAASANPYTDTVTFTNTTNGSGNQTRSISLAVIAPVTNQAPSVSAGSDATIDLSASASLNGTVTDDGLPNPPGAVTTTWSKVSGPGTVTFSNPSAVDTSATFSQIGMYVLRLTANDGALSASDDVTITVVNPVTGAWDIVTLDDSNGNVTNQSTGYCSSFDIDTNGKIHVSYFDYGGNLRYVTNASGAWVATTLDGTSGSYCAGSLDLDQSGKVHIAYHDETAHALKYQTNVSGNWVSQSVDSVGNAADPGGKFGRQVSLAVDSNAKAHICYFDEGNWDLRYVTNASGVWQPVTVDAGIAGQWCSLGLDTNGKAHVSYIAFESNKYVLKYATNASGAWQPLTIDNSSVSPSATSLAVDSNNKIHVSYLESSTGSGLKYATNASGSWEWSLIDNTVHTYIDTSLAVDASNKVHIAYNGYTTTLNQLDLRYITNLSGPWATSIISPATGEGVSTLKVRIKVDNAGMVHLTYARAARPETLKYATKPAAAASPYTLLVQKFGTGSGTVTSTPTGISCGINCLASFSSGTPVTLVATAEGGSTFTGWGGACSGSGTCSFPMNAVRSATASFEQQPDVEVVPLTWDFGLVALSTTTSKVFTIGNTGTATLNVSGTTIVGPDANQFSILSGGGAFSVGPGGQKHEITIGFAPTSVGLKSAGLRITSNDPDENPKDVPLSGTGTVAVPSNQAPTVSAGPDLTITLPTSASLDGTVNDDGLPKPPGAFTVTWSKLSGPGTVTFGNSSAVDTTASFFQGGTYVLRLTANDGALSNSDDVTISVNPAPADMPDITVTPLPVPDFGSVPVNTTSAAKTVTVKNDGNANLVIGVITLGGVNPGDFIKGTDGCTNQTLAPTGQCTVEVSFRPNSVGPKNANLVIPSNDPDPAENPVNDGLSGTGVALPSLFINDVTANEGNSGTASFDFMVSLSAASSETVTVNFATADGTATGETNCNPGVDYVTKSGTLTFPPEQTTPQQITVQVCGDTVNEPNETFFVNLTSATNATISDGQGVGTIINDDALLDHFLGYKITPGALLRFDTPLILTDQFDTEEVRQIKPEKLFNPVDKNGGGINNPNIHLERYKLLGGQPVLSKKLRVQNQFGEITITKIKPDSLLVPTAKSLTDPVDPPDPATHNVDHFKCYRVLRSTENPRSRGIKPHLIDQFLDQDFEIVKPSRLCNPVDKNGEGIKNPAAHLMCYQLKPVDNKVAVHLSNQFGIEKHRTVRADELCVPSTKEVLAP